MDIDVDKERKITKKSTHTIINTKLQTHGKFYLKHFRVLLNTVSTKSTLYFSAWVCYKRVTESKREL